MNMPEKEAMEDQHKVEFQHPLCHYINGERLYYVLMKVKTHVFGVGKKIDQALKEEHLHQSSCGYYLFGASDILLRIWGSERRVLSFKKKLESFDEISGEPEFMLISSMETWYQREIESRQDWAAVLTGGNFDTLHATKKVPDCLRVPEILPEKPAKRNKLIRFFVFVRDDSGKNKPLMSTLRRRFGMPKEKLFVDDHRISIYSTYSPTFAGLMIKGETTRFAEVAPLLVEFAEEQKDQQRFTTTYICSSSIKAEANSMVEPGADGTPHGARRGDTLHNLLISEGCNHPLINQMAARAAAAHEFVNKLTPKLGQFFHFHEEWWAYTKDFRLLFKWCVMEDNDQLHAYLMRHFAKVEHELREMIWPVYSREKQRDQAERFRELLKKAGNRIGALLPKSNAGEKTGAEVTVMKISEVLTAVFEPEFLTIELEPEHDEPMSEAEKEELEDEKRKELTMGPIANYLISLAKGMKDPSKETLSDFAKAMLQCAKQRNRIAHGSLQDLTKPDQQAESFPWERPVLGFIRMMLLKPSAVVIVKKYVAQSLNADQEPSSLPPNKKWVGDDS